MKKYKQILEAINKGINLALDSFEDQNNDIQQLTHGKVKGTNITKEYLDLFDVVVDLGLPSGTLWCKCNLGAKRETDRGKYYAWGEIKTKHQKKYNISNYRFAVQNNDMCDYIKYCNKPQLGYIGFTDNLTLLQNADDAAYQNMHVHGFEFHIPTVDLFNELLLYTNIEYKEYKGHNGWIFTSKVNGNKMFIPTCGCIDSNGKIAKKDLLCFLWSADMVKNDMTCAYFLNLYNTFIAMRLAARTVGLSIRPVINL